MLYIALVWASAILFVKTEEATIPPITIMAGRAIFAFLTLFAVALITHKKITAVISYFPKFLLLSLIGIVIVWLGLAFGQEYLTVGLASVLVTVTPPLSHSSFLYFSSGWSRLVSQGLAVC
jgi:drug/metabolite transporter (DMT)-like permease